MTKSALSASKSAISGRFINMTIGAVLGATLLIAPLCAMAEPAHAHHAMRHSAESVEERITHLHAELKIKDDQEADWRTVAQVMRDNEAAMRKMAADNTALPGHPVTAVDDLRTYERFSQAHVNGLKSLIGAFETLYNTMPDAQKANADNVFKKFGRQAHRTVS